VIPEPLGQFAGAASAGRVERRQLVVADPVAVGAPFEEVLGRAPLPAVAGAPEGAGDLVGRRRIVAGEGILDAVGPMR
jgi:hypothetical protein